MITRYRISFEDRLIEPDINGKWVKHEDVAEIEASAHSKAQEMALESQQSERAELQERIQQVAELTATRDALVGELAVQNALNESQSKLLQAAKARITLHGHAPNCSSRYGRKVAGGHAAVEACDCELEEWLSENGYG